MVKQYFFVVEVICWALGAFFGIAGLAIKVIEAGQTADAQAKTKQWYARKWDAIRAARLLELPRVVIIWLLKASRALKRTLVKVPEAVAPIILGVFFEFGLIPILGLVGAWIAFGCITALVLGPAFFAWTIVGMFRPTSGTFVRGSRSELYSALAPLVVCFLTCFVWIAACLRLPIGYATLIAVLFLPVYGTMFAMPIVWVLVEVKAQATSPKKWLDEDSWTVTGVSMAVSVAATHLSLFVGHMIAPSATLPQTLQMIIANIACDALSVVATLEILRLATMPRRAFAVPVAVVTTTIASGILAFASLWLGVVGGPGHLSAVEVGRVLIGHSPDGANWELGPMFWAMHTTFIPTLAFLTLVIVCWIARLVVLPIAHVLYKGREVEKPHNLTVATLALMAAVFVALSQLAKYARQ